MLRKAFTNKNNKYSIFLAIIFILLVILIKIRFLPIIDSSLKEKSIEKEIKFSLDFKIEKYDLFLIISTKVLNNLFAGLYNLEIYLDNKKVETLSIYIDRKLNNLYTKLRYKNEREIKIIIYNEEREYTFRKKL